MLFLVFRRSLHAFFFGVLTVGFPALCAVRRSQPETQSAFFDFKGEATLLIVIGLAAMIRVHSSKLAEPLFQFRIMGLNLDQIIIFIKINGSCFLPFVKSCFHEIPPKLGNFSRLKSRESGRIFRWKVSKRYRHRLKHSHRIFSGFSGS